MVVAQETLMDVLDEAMMGDHPSNRREDPDVAKAFMLGAVACPTCGQVHIDLVDAENRIFATAELSFEQFIELAYQVMSDIDRLDDRPRKGH
jgi:hypothetical protein